MMTKRTQTGMAGEFYIYSQLLKAGKNCFITLGNAKSVDLIIIDGNKKAHFIDVKSTSSVMKIVKSHPHENYNEHTDKHIGRWQLPITIFWQTHPKNIQKEPYQFADYYIFHNLNNQNENIIIRFQDLETIIHKRIDKYLGTDKRAIEKKHLCNWEFCDLCFSEFRRYNNWDALPQ